MLNKFVLENVCSTVAAGIIPLTRPLTDRDDIAKCLQYLDHIYLWVVDQWILKVWIEGGAELDSIV